MILKIALALIPLAWLFASFQLSARRTQKRLQKESAELTDRELLRLNARLAAAAGIGDVRVSVHDTPAINGLATPNGEIYLTRGLLDCYRAGKFTAPEICSVVAHELGHVALGHTKKRMAVFASQNAMRMALGMLLGRFIPVVGGLLASAVVHLLGSGLSRADELEADKYASALLIKAGLGTEPQKRMLLNLEKAVGRPTSGIAWLMSHPSIPRRIGAIENNERRWQQENG